MDIQVRRGERRHLPGEGGVKQTLAQREALRRPPKCKHCRKSAGEHNATTRACPLGRKLRTIGWSQWSALHRFEPKASPP
jgi:hypothetical protein